MPGFFKLVITALIVACNLFAVFPTLLHAGESDAILAGAQKEVELITWAVGEIPIMAVAFAPRVSVVRASGAPIDWAALNPVFSNPVGMGIYKAAPHPNAAKLYVDFMLSKEIQQEILVNAAWKRSARKDVTPKDPRWQGIKVLPLDLTLAHGYQEIAKDFRQIFKAHGGGR